MSCNIGGNVDGDGIDVLDMKFVLNDLHQEVKKIRSDVSEISKFFKETLKKTSWSPPPSFEDINALPLMQRFSYCTLINKDTYNILDNMFGDDAKAKIGRWGGRKIEWSGGESSLRTVAKKVSRILSRTITLSDQDKEISRRVTDKINSMWKEAEVLIKSRNIFMRILFKINNLFSWKFTIQLPK